MKVSKRRRAARHKTKTGQWRVIDIPTGWRESEPYPQPSDTDRYFDNESAAIQEQLERELPVVTDEEVDLLPAARQKAIDDAIGRHHNGERAALRQEWDRLRGEHQDLLADTARLHGSHDLPAIREHHERIRAHQARLQAWEHAMEVFHGARGAIGLKPDASSTS